MRERSQGKLFPDARLIVIEALNYLIQIDIFPKKVWFAA